MDPAAPEAVPNSPLSAPGKVSGSRGGGGGRFGQQATESTPRVSMVPQATEVAVGDRISVRVRITEATNVGSVPFHVLFNSAVLKFEGGEEGSFLSGGGRETAFFAAPTTSGNEVVVGLSRLGSGDGIDGGGELCVLNFTVVGPGDAGLTFSRAKVRDSENRIVPSIFEAASVAAH